MQPKYQIGDIIADESLFYLIEGIDYCGYESLCYVLRLLNNNTTRPAYVSLVDNGKLKLVA